jgi:hypothetical protein
LVAIITILANYNLGQIVVYELNFSKKIQLIFFWICTPIILILIFYWNIHQEISIANEVGLIIGSILLLANIAIESRKNYRIDKGILLEK